ncbi:hypothetical protein A7K94_0206135 [Modestobacter sp. VKM Ac-2676]|nr:hypothetical protein A7K94_0206135 [Modestobacter sp. VKM Ac-2676]
MPAAPSRAPDQLCTVARTTSSHGVAVSPKVSVVPVASRTNSWSHWCRIATISRISGTASPAARSTGQGVPVTFAGGAPIARARSLSACRWDRGAELGTCHARPQDRSSAPSAIRVAAASGTLVQLRGTSGSPITHARRPRRRVSSWRIRCDWAGGRRPDEVRRPGLGGPQPAVLLRGEGIGPHPGPQPPLASVAANGVSGVIGPDGRPYPYRLPMITRPAPDRSAAVSSAVAIGGQSRAQVVYLGGLTAL